MPPNSPRNGVFALQGAVRLVEHVHVVALVGQRLVAVDGHERVDQYRRVVFCGNRSELVVEVRVDFGVGVERALRKDDEVERPLELVGQREVVGGKPLIDLVRERQLLVVTLQHCEVQAARGRGVEPGCPGDHCDEQHRSQAGGGERARSDRPGVHRAREVDEEACGGHDDE
jgi:hypothetical protein